METRSTTDYKSFKFLQENRAKIDESNVKKIMASLKSRNLMHLKPVLVDGNMQIIDGQHRVLACERLGIPVIYQIDPTLACEDIILMNNQRPWFTSDYFNFFIQKRRPEYLKLQSFMHKHSLSLKIALNILHGTSQNFANEFRKGNYVFKEDMMDQNFECAWIIIDLIKRIAIGNKNWCKSSKFWKALFILINHENFELKKFLSNAEKKAERFGPRATINDYLRMFEVVCKGRSKIDISLAKDDEDC